ncbi:MAG: hypothetical protein D6729_05165 [Deltaproteobacteria bacterium]|nr:MAG: hypothetical protein D6729_05165 [Deltaproteobacteria bacterium]
MTVRHQRSLLVLTAVGLLATGCPPATVSNGGDGGVVGDGTCSVDAECRAGFRCDRERRRCVCTGDDACPANLFCNAFTGQCVSEVPGCTQDGECGPNQYCEVETRTCRTRRGYCEPCTEDRQCGGASDRCIEDPTIGRHFCGKACQGDGDCEQGSTCQTIGGVKTCWPSVATCEQVAGCNPNTGQSCQQDSDCTEGEDQVCDQLQGTCVARVPTCPFGTVCNRDTRQCEAACTIDDDCAAHEDCQTTPCRCTNNECVQILLCRDNSECEPGQVCIVPPGQTEGECGPSCSSDAECPQGQVCTDLGSRRACVDGCTSNADCPLNSNCSGGRCVPGCQTTAVCQPCEICQPINPQVKACTQVSGYCEVCTAPANGCSTLDGTRYCCDTGPTDYLGVDCSGGRGCPAGFACVDIVDLAGTVIAQNCFPTANVCSDPSCN